MENSFSYFTAVPMFSNSIIPTINIPLQVFQQMSMRITSQNQQISHLREQNQDLKTLLKNSQNEKQAEISRSQEVQLANQCQNIRKKSKPQRTFYCDYQNCDRVYASTLALNLHIKTKHNGGTKKQRDAYAKLIVMADLNGQPIPQINFSFPKNYIKNFKQKLLAQKNQSGCQNLSFQNKRLSFPESQ